MGQASTWEMARRRQLEYRGKWTQRRAAPALAAIPDLTFENGCFAGPGESCPFGSSSCERDHLKSLSHKKEMPNNPSLSNCIRFVYFDTNVSLATISLSKCEDINQSYY